mmetsp:Transcript_20597/g.49172  ORF Transcript_20597/g.49172 Transcript_20597/m.49172 type:complete len:227 (+) Transcript_20597:1774-2454(+)
MHARESRDHHVQKVLGDHLAVRGSNSVGVEVDPDVAHQQYHAPWEGDPLAVGGLPAHVWVHFARDRLPALAHARGQRPLHQARPRAVHLDLVLSVDSSHRVLAVRDRSERRLDDDVLDACRVSLSDRGVRVDLDIKVQPVVDEEDGRERAPGVPEAGELLGLEEGEILAGHRHQQATVLDVVGGGILVARGALKGEKLVQVVMHPVKDLLSAHRVVPARAPRVPVF